MPDVKREKQDLKSRHRLVFQKYCLKDSEEFIGQQYLLTYLHI